MEAILKLKPSGCKDCYKCIRDCPVKAIRFSENQAEIIEEECILCGRCYVACPQNAKLVREDAAAVKTAIRAGKRVVAGIAPSFIAAFEVGGIDDMRAALQKLGFADVQETAVGAQFVSDRYDEMLREGKRKVLISSCCPAINSLIQKYYPDLLGELAHVLTPMQAHFKAVKEADPQAFTVFIGPCVAKKKEADESPWADACLTFDEADAWLAQEGVALSNTAPAGERPKSRLYPTTGGILATMSRQAGWDYLAIDGVNNCRSALEEIRQGRVENAFIEMSACEGSCVGGPILRERAQRRLTGAIRVKRFSGEARFPDQAPEDMAMPLPQTKLHRVMPGSAAIQEVLLRMGKDSPDKELNCGSCGYPTCRDKAIAVCQGKAEIEMCLPFLKAKAESFSDKIISATPNAILVMDESLIVHEINRAACKLFKLTSADDILQAPIVRLLDPSDYLNVVSTGKNVVNKCRYIAEYKLFVEETILFDPQYRILISIMRDVTDRETNREKDNELRKQTIEVTDRVIDKQMRVVQEIASLLGETTAETKVALTKLKDAMLNDE